jgi:hypothetical protein
MENVPKENLPYVKVTRLLLAAIFALLAFLVWSAWRHKKISGAQNAS